MKKNDDSGYEIKLFCREDKSEQRMERKTEIRKKK